MTLGVHRRDRETLLAESFSAACLSHGQELELFMTRRALLIFAESAHIDCARRGWPRSFRNLLEIHSFCAQQQKDFDTHLFTSGFHPANEQLTGIHAQAGVSFAERLDNAVEALTRLGYQEIVIIGRDCPDLELQDIHLAFDELHRHRLVIGPDHRGGCYLIGIHASDRSKLRGVRWQRNTDSRALLRRFGPQNAFQLAVKMDLDTWGDLRLLARSRSPWRYLAEFLLDSQLTNGTKASAAEKRDPILLQRKDWQLPPPSPAVSVRHP